MDQRMQCDLLVLGKVLLSEFVLGRNHGCRHCILLGVWQCEAIHPNLAYSNLAYSNLAENPIYPNLAYSNLAGLTYVS